MIKYLVLNNNNNTNEGTKNKRTNKLVKEKEKENFLKEFNELDISRCMDNLAAEELGVMPGLEIPYSKYNI